MLLVISQLRNESEAGLRIRLGFTQIGIRPFIKKTESGPDLREQKPDSTSEKKLDLEPDTT